MSRFGDARRELKMKQITANGGNTEVLQERMDSEASKTLAKVGLDTDSASKAAIKQLNAASVEKIRADMRGNGLLKAGLTLGGNATERAQLGYLSALTEQNWILIRQNELLIRLLDKG
jgi:hypothetical protein